MKQKSKLFFAAAPILAIGIMAAAPALAAPNASGLMAKIKNVIHGNKQVQNMANRLGVMGTVSAINGSALTVVGRTGFNTSTAVVNYNIDASQAVVVKNNVTSTVSSIAVGDVIEARGTISGTSVVATMIRDGLKVVPGGRQGRPNGLGSSTPPFVGNGQPVIAGKISAISGTAVTVNTASNVQYTVDVSNAKIMKSRGTATPANLSVNDNVVVQGAVNGTAVTASSIIDQVKPVKINNGQEQNQAPTAIDTNNNQPAVNHLGIIGKIGGFFKKLFGF